MVPISTEQVFSDFWQPACAKLNLRWVPLFQVGLDIEKEDILPILEELNQLKEYFNSPIEFEGDTDDLLYITSRIDNLIKALTEMLDTEGQNLFIG